MLKQVISTAVADHRGSNYSGGVRQYIEKFLSGHEEYRITGVRSDTYISDMRNSKFCLAPEGVLFVLMLVASHSYVVRTACEQIY